MKTKPLFVLISNGGDGSYHARYTFDRDLIDRLEKAADDGRMDYDSGISMDGDGFHYDTLAVPEECTAETLGIVLLDEDDFDDWLE